MWRKVITFLICISLISLWLCGQRVYTVSWIMRETIEQDCCDSMCTITHYIYRDKGIYSKNFYRRDSAQRFYNAAIQEQKKLPGLILHVRLEEQ